MPEERQREEERQTAHELAVLKRQLAEQIARTERTRAEAEEAHAAKAMFLASMSHELRTPLNAIEGYLELLDLELRGPLTEGQREYLFRIRRNQRHLLRLVNDILGFAKIESGKIEYRLSDFPVEEALSTLDMLIGPQVRAKGVDYRHEHGDPLVRVRADKERVDQILLNLLSNAVKFTPSGGQIWVAWSPGDDDVAIDVSDTGPGIPEDRLEVIFQPFVQVARRDTTAPEGVGLGLAISRDLARAMGGELAARSVPGEGSTFTLLLPRVA